MANEKCLICAYCFISFGKGSHKLIKVTPAVQLHIQNLFWREYDVEKECCPKNICNSCKTNLYALNRGETSKLNDWIEKISQISRQKFRRSSDISEVSGQITTNNQNIVDKVVKKICPSCFSTIGEEISRFCCKSEAVKNLIMLAEGLGNVSSNQVASGILKIKIKRQN
ncbi:uncharacterized protein LOC136078229 [Hydra vulgaris]|uniref:Uncharacterized protein LOC136078229 n=1 Tax=Hydra vulgaris TaxID=6087 RepID=A0ABM4BKI2_HYDVU